MRIVGLISVLAMAAALPSAANAVAITGLFNTGVDAMGAQLAADGGIDTHYLIGAAPTVTYTNSAYVSLTDGRFISPAAGGAGGSQTYTLTFSLAGLDAATAQLSGSWAADNGIEILLNNTRLVYDVPSNPGLVSTFDQLHAFTASSAAFKSGVNTLTFNVTDYGPPTAFAISGLSGTADLAGAVPEASTWAMMLGGFGAVGATMRRRRTTSAHA